jgi:multiple sugar transport system ATP-binding protein
MATVELDHLQKVYAGGFAAVRDLCLQINDGELMVVVGPSGCGKSTALRMIAGLEEVTAGRISIDGKLVNDVPPKDRDIAMVFQSYALYPHMTVFENLAFSLSLRHWPKPEMAKKVKETADLLGIAHLLDQRPKQLSGGERQRVAVGRAIVRDPKCFLFDEPLSNLDAKLRIEMRAMLKHLHVQLGSTTIYVTHDQEEASTMGDRVAVMRDGVLQQCASPLHIYHYPHNRFVAGFFGNPPMNFFEGRLVEESGQLLFDEGEGRLPIPGWAVDRLRAHGGPEVVLGLRPEALAPVERAHFAQMVQLPMRVWLVQPLGAVMDVYLATRRHNRVVAHMDAHAGVTVDRVLAMAIDMEQAHFFAPGEPGCAIVSNPRTLF